MEHDIWIVILIAYFAIGWFMWLISFGVSENSGNRNVIADHFIFTLLFWVTFVPMLFIKFIKWLWNDINEVFEEMKTEI